MSAPIAAAISRTRAGFQVAAQAREAGKTVACQALKPVRHSSCAIAGIAEAVGGHDPLLQGR
jgi:hypothetical protein